MTASQRKYAHALIAAGTIVMSAVGCGGSSSTGTGKGDAHAAFLRAVEKVCARAVAAHAGHTFPVVGFDPEHPDPRRLPTVGDYFARYGGLPTTTAALHRLSPPARDATRWRDLLVTADRMTANAQRQIKAAHARDVPTFVATVHAANQLIPRLNAAGRRVGISDGSPCRQVYG